MISARSHSNRNSSKPTLTSIVDLSAQQFCRQNNIHGLSDDKLDRVVSSSVALVSSSLLQCGSRAETM